jgi:hypothetical protein
VLLHRAWVAWLAGVKAAAARRAQKQALLLAARQELEAARLERLFAAWHEVHVHSMLKCFQVRLWCGLICDHSTMGCIQGLPWWLSNLKHSQQILKYYAASVPLSPQRRRWRAPTTSRAPRCAHVRYAACGLPLPGEQSAVVAPLQLPRTGGVVR